VQIGWASMSTAGNLTLNSQLLDLPQPLDEYVIVHELRHLLAPKHGKVFKSFMHAYCRIGGNANVRSKRNTACQSIC